MARVKKSLFYQSVEGKLSQVMAIIYKHEIGQKVTEAEVTFALEALKLVYQEINKELPEVSHA